MNSSDLSSLVSGSTARTNFKFENIYPPSTTYTTAEAAPNSSIQNYHVLSSSSLSNPSGICFAGVSDPQKSPPCPQGGAIFNGQSSFIIVALTINSSDANVPNGTYYSYGKIFNSPNNPDGNFDMSAGNLRISSLLYNLRLSDGSYPIVRVYNPSTKDTSYQTNVLYYSPFNLNNYELENDINNGALYGEVVSL